MLLPGEGRYCFVRFRQNARPDPRSGPLGKMQDLTLVLVGAPQYQEL
jgi:hypothetical protein